MLILDAIFLSGPLLEAVQMSRLYRDSKTFVDKKLKFPPGKIIKNFQELLARQNGGPLSLDQVKLVNIRLYLSLLDYCQSLPCFI